MEEATTSWSGVAEGGESRLDLAGLVLIAVVALVSGILALVGVQYAAWVFLSGLGALVGDGLMYLAIRSRRWRIPLVLLLLVVLGLASAWLSVSFLFGSRPPWEVSAPLTFFVLGIGCGFGGLVLSRLFGPSVLLHGPRTWDEAVEQRRGVIHGTFVFGAFLLAFLVLIVAVLGFLYLVARAAAVFTGSG